MDLKNLSAAVNQIAEERGLKPEQIIKAIEAALASAYKKEYGNSRAEIIRAKFDVETGDIKFWRVKIAVDPAKIKIESEEDQAASQPAQAQPKKEEDEEGLIRYNPERHILLAEAKKYKPDVQPGDEIIFPLESHSEFGRIAAQTAKQVILQNIREEERQSIKAEFKDKEGQVISGVIQRFERGYVYVDLGRAVGVMFQNESIPGEHYRPGQRMRFYVLAVQDEDRRKPGIILSRAHPEFVAKLFEMEVPEIAEGIVEIKKIAREPGSRTKIAVVSNQDSIDPVGSLIGQRGSRIMAVTNELGNEKIDVVEWSDDPKKFIANALSPAKVKLVEIKPRREALVLVPEDQLSLAIGRGGQNVRLTAKLTGWKIDVRSQSNPDEVQEGGIAAFEAEETALEGNQTDTADNLSASEFLEESAGDNSQPEKKDAASEDSPEKPQPEPEQAPELEETEPEELEETEPEELELEETEPEELEPEPEPKKPETENKN